MPNKKVISEGYDGSYPTLWMPREKCNMNIIHKIPIFFRWDSKPCRRRIVYSIKARPMVPTRNRTRDYKTPQLPMRSHDFVRRTRRKRTAQRVRHLVTGTQPGPTELHAKRPTNHPVSSAVAPIQPDRARGKRQQSSLTYEPRSILRRSSKCARRNDLLHHAPHLTDAVLRHKRPRRIMDAHHRRPNVHLLESIEHRILPFPNRRQIPTGNVAQDASRIGQADSEIKTWS